MELRVRYQQEITIVFALMVTQDLLAILVIYLYQLVTIFVVLFSLANFTEPITSSTIQENNVGAVVGVAVGVGTLFLTVIVITAGLVCYFYRSKKTFDESTATLIPIELDNKNISLSKSESLDPFNENVEIENSS